MSEFLDTTEAPTLPETQERHREIPTESPAGGPLVLYEVRHNPAVRSFRQFVSLLSVLAMGATLRSFPWPWLLIEFRGLNETTVLAITLAVTSPIGWGLLAAYGWAWRNSRTDQEFLRVFFGTAICAAATIGVVTLAAADRALMVTAIAGTWALNVWGGVQVYGRVRAALTAANHDEEEARAAAQKDRLPPMSWTMRILVLVLNVPTLLLLRWRLPARTTTNLDSHLVVLAILALTCLGWYLLVADITFWRRRRSGREKLILVFGSLAGGTTAAWMLIWKHYGGMVLFEGQMMAWIAFVSLSALLLWCGQAIKRRFRRT